MLSPTFSCDDWSGGVFLAIVFDILSFLEGYKCWGCNEAIDLSLMVLKHFKFF
jgi:hypothetical protein